MAVRHRVSKTNSQPRLSKTARAPIISAYLVLFIFAVLCVCVVLFAEVPVPPPTAEPRRVVAWTETQLDPEDFVSEVTGENLSINFEYFNPIAHFTGSFDVVVSLADEYGNVTQVASELYAYKPRESVMAGIGDNISQLGVSDFIDGQILPEDEHLFAMPTNIRGIDTENTGSHRIDIYLNGIEPPFPVTIEIADVTAPQGIGLVVERWTVDELDPRDFVSGIIDDTEVTVSFLNEPDRTIEGEQQVQVLLTDASGNTTTVTSTLIQTRDTEPPVITGELDKAVCIGEAILYRAGITVTDNRDEEVVLEIDSSAVDASAEGTYPVVYSATDESGNTTTAEGTLTVYALDIEVVNAMIEEILGSILTDGMTQREQAQAIFNYVHDRITYGAGRVYDNVHYGAYRALITGSGDCYAYYALSELLLTAAGIENMGIERKPGYPTRHFWNLVNLGEGWYHFDPLPQLQSGGFMFTDTSAREITVRAAHVVEGYYDYDETLYPEIVQ